MNIAIGKGKKQHDKRQTKNKEIGIEKNLEYFADQVNENYSTWLKYTF